MKRKKIMALIAAGIFAMVAGLSGTADAAVGGMRAPRMTTPRMTTPKPRTTTPAPSQNARPNQQYRPSQKASDIPSTAPRTAAPSPGASANSVPYNGTRWGNMMRNFGLLAGGMMLGGLLGNLFGFGAGSFMGDLFGLLINGFLVYLAVVLLLRLFGALRGKSSSREKPYRQEARETGQGANFPIPDIRPPQKAQGFVAHGGTDYEPKRTADWYRSR